MHIQVWREQYLKIIKRTHSFSQLSHAMATPFDHFIQTIKPNEYVSRNVITIVVLLSSPLRSREIKQIYSRATFETGR